MTFAIVADGAAVEIPPRVRTFVDAQGTTHSTQVLAAWTLEELSAIGVFPIENGVVPAGHSVTGSALVFEPGPPARVVRVFETQPDAPPDAARLKAHAERKRWEIEVGGIDVAGMRIATDDRSKVLINGAHALAIEDPAAVFDFRAVGAWAQTDAATVRAIAVAVGRHVQTMFSRHRAAEEAVDAGTATTFAEIDAILEGGGR